MNVYFLIRNTNDPSEEEKFAIMELGSNKDSLMALLDAYVKQFCDDHDVITVEEISNGAEITYEWLDDEEPHKTSFVILGGHPDLFFRKSA